MHFFEKFGLLIIVLVLVKEARTCNRYQFQCDNGECVWMTDVCDQKKDCNDGSDEAGCRYQIDPCVYDEIPCDDDRSCIPSLWKCDGEKDCKDGSDEKQCERIRPPPIYCSSDEFKCENGRGCISPFWKCDGEKDCEDGSDEKQCGEQP